MGDGGQSRRLAGSLQVFAQWLVDVSGDDMSFQSI